MVLHQGCKSEGIQYNLCALIYMYCLFCSGLEKVLVPTGEGFGIFNGQNFVFRTSTMSIFTKLRMLFRYGLSLLSVNRHVDDMLKRFCEIYSLQQHNGQTFHTVPDMLKAVGGENFYHMTQVSLVKVYFLRVPYVNKCSVFLITLNRNQW